MQRVHVSAHRVCIVTISIAMVTEHAALLSGA